MDSPGSFNPYAPPRSGGIVQPEEDLRLDGDLASRWQRLGGALFDTLLIFIARAPAYAGVSSMAAVAQKGARLKNPFYLYMHAGRWGVVTAMVSAALLAVQWWLLVKRGQTVGKMVARTRVVRTDGSRADFVHVLALRDWPVFVLGILAATSSVLSIIDMLDYLFVFRPDRRCLHDLIAGTKVVRVPNAW